MAVSWWPAGTETYFLTGSQCVWLFGLIYSSSFCLRLRISHNIVSERVNTALLSLFIMLDFWSLDFFLHFKTFPRRILLAVPYLGKQRHACMEARRLSSFSHNWVHLEKCCPAKSPHFLVDFHDADSRQYANSPSCDKKTERTRNQK